MRSRSPPLCRAPQLPLRSPPWLPWAARPFPATNPPPPPRPRPVAASQAELAPVQALFKAFWAAVGQTLLFGLLGAQVGDMTALWRLSDGSLAALWRLSGGSLAAL
jgi:hypothetical protein